MSFLVTPLWWLVVLLLVFVSQVLKFVYRSVVSVHRLLVLVSRMLVFLYQMCTIFATLGLLGCQLLALLVQCLDLLTNPVSRAVESFVFLSLLQLCSPLPFFNIVIALNKSRARGLHAYLTGVFSLSTDALCRRHHNASHSAKSVVSKTLKAMTWEPAMFKVVT